jgi:hypothetical protein
MMAASGRGETVFDHLGKAHARIASAPTPTAVAGAGSKATNARENVDGYVRQRVLAGGQYWPDFPLNFLLSQADQHLAMSRGWASFEAATRDAVVNQAHLLRGDAGDSRAERLRRIATEHAHGHGESVTHRTAVSEMYEAVSDAQQQLNGIVSDAAVEWRAHMHADNRAAAEQKLDLAATEAAAVCTECRMSVTTTMLEWRTSVGSDPFPADTPGGRRPQTIRMERRHSQEPT